MREAGGMPKMGQLEVFSDLQELRDAGAHDSGERFSIDESLFELVR